MQFLSYSTLLFAVPFLSHTLASSCPITGPLLPPPQQLSTSALIRAAGEKLGALYDLALSGSIVAGWQTNITSFSIVLTDASNSPLWEYHHTASGNVNNTGDVNGDTQFRVASVTKVFTDLLLLKLGLDLDDPITKYLPELAYNDSPIRWKEITLGSLGNHLAAIPTGYGYLDIYSAGPYLETLGFPPLAVSDYPLCGVFGLSSTCTRKQHLIGLSKSRPVFPPFSRPVYSSVSFTLLGYVIEDVTGRTFEEVLEREIIQPLGMKNTGLRPKSEASGVIPPIDNLWSEELGDNNPGAGLYSTTNDLSLLLQGILSRSILPTPSQVRQWLKPTAETASLYNSVGMPWEIVRAANLTPAHPHVIDIYTKDGHVPGYTSRIGVIGEYEFGFTILTAGSFDSMNPLTEALLSVFLPAIEETTRDEAKEYVGNFSTPANSTVKSHIIFTIDDGPGLKITEAFSNSSDLLAGVAALREFALGSAGDAEFDLRIYPAGISDTIDPDETTGTFGASIKEDWRLVIEPWGPTFSELPSQKVYDEVCTTWMSHDVLYYGGRPADRFVFLKKEGKVVGIEIPFLRITLMKQ